MPVFSKCVRAERENGGVAVKKKRISDRSVKVKKHLKVIYATSLHARKRLILTSIGAPLWNSLLGDSLPRRVACMMAFRNEKTQQARWK